MNTQENQSPGDPTIEAALAATILDWAAFLRRHWLALLVVLIVAGGLGYAYTLRLPTIYRANLKAMLYEPPRAIMAYGGLLGLADEKNPHVILAQLYAQIGLSEEILSAALDYPYQEGSLRDALNRTGARSDEALVRDLRGAVSIAIQRRTHILLLTATHRDPNLPPVILNAVAAAMDHHFGTQLETSARYQREVLDKRLEQILRMQTEARDLLTAFDREHAGPSLSPEAHLERERLMRSFVAADQAAEEQKSLILKTELLAIAEKHAGSVVQTLEAPRIPRRPAAPARLKITLIVAVIGLVLGVLYLRTYDAVRRYR